jgi:type I restriction enzyme S subunit
MNSHWPFNRVSELVDRGLLHIGDGYRVRLSQLSRDGIPFVRGGDIQDGWIDTNVEDHISPRYYNELLTKLSRAWDVAFITKGTVGRVGILRPEQPQIVFAPQVCFWRSMNEQGLVPRFLFYLLRSHWFQALLSSVKTHGSMAADYVSIGDQYQFNLPIPPPAEQRRIAAVLSALDDKIELNRKMNCTLEGMAQAIFHARFMDFDGQVDLVTSELGPIPKAWRLGTLYDIAENHRNSVNPDEVEPNTPYIGLADMPQGSIALGTWGFASDAMSAKTMFRAGDMLFGKLRPYFKKVGVAPVDGVCSSDVLVIRPKLQYWQSYILGVLTYDPFIKFVSTASTGTRMPRTSWQIMSSYKLAIPPMQKAVEFHEICESFIHRIMHNVQESRTLAELRDTLLPKLISGELRVPGAERVVEQAL